MRTITKVYLSEDDLCTLGQACEILQAIATLILGAWWGYTLAIVTGKLEQRMGKRNGKK